MLRRFVTFTHLPKTKKSAFPPVGSNGLLPGGRADTNDTSSVPTSVHL